MAHRILIADPDEAFGLMLKQMLEMNGDYSAEHVSSGERALAVVQQSAPDLVILDLMIADIAPAALVLALQAAAPRMRVMLIPVGDSLPAELNELSIQGTLTKPFFIGDLGSCIAQALGTDTKPLVHLPPPPEKKPVEPARPRVRQIVQTPARQSEPADTRPLAPPVREEPRAPAPTATPRVRQIIQPPARPRERTVPTNGAAPSATPQTLAALDPILNALAREIRADGVLVLHNSALLTQRSAFASTRIESFVELVQRWLKVAGEMASFVGDAYGHFQQLHLEGERYQLYAFDQGNGLVLVAVSRKDVTIGTLRLHMRAAAAEIAKVLRA